MSDIRERFLRDHEAELRRFGFNREEPPEGLDALLARYGARTIWAILRCRKVLRTTDAPFRVGAASDLTAIRRDVEREGCVLFEVLHQTTDATEARIVEADTRTHLLYHYPGRCLNKGDYRPQPLEPGSDHHVYLAALTAPAAELLGRA